MTRHCSFAGRQVPSAPPPGRSLSAERRTKRSMRRLLLASAVLLFTGAIRSEPAEAGGFSDSFDRYRGKWPKIVTTNGATIARATGANHPHIGDWSLHITSEATRTAYLKSRSFPLDLSNPGGYDIETDYWPAEAANWVRVLDNGHVHIVHDNGKLKYRTQAGVNVDIVPIQLARWYTIYCRVKPTQGNYIIQVFDAAGLELASVFGVPFYANNPYSYLSGHYFLTMGDFNPAADRCNSYWDRISVHQNGRAEFIDGFEDDSLTPRWTNIQQQGSSSYFGQTNVDAAVGEMALLVHSPNQTGSNAFGLTPGFSFDPNRKYTARVDFKLASGSNHWIILLDNGQVFVVLRGNDQIVAYEGDFGGERLIADGLSEGEWYTLQVGATPDPGNARGTYWAEVYETDAPRPILIGRRADNLFFQENAYTNASGKNYMRVGDPSTQSNYGTVYIDELQLKQTSGRGLAAGSGGRGSTVGDGGVGGFNLVDLTWAISDDLIDVAWHPSTGMAYLAGGRAGDHAAVYATNADPANPDPTQILPPEHQPGGMLKGMDWMPPVGASALLVGERANGVGPARIFTLADGTFAPVAHTPSAPYDLNDVAWKPDGSMALLVGGEEGYGLGAVLAYEPGVGVHEIALGSFGPCRAVSWNPVGTEALIVTGSPSPGIPGSVLVFDGATLVPIPYTPTLPWDLRCVDYHPDPGLSLAVIGGGGPSAMQGVLLRYEGGTLEEMGAAEPVGAIRTVAWEPDSTFALAIATHPSGETTCLITDGQGYGRLFGQGLGQINAFAWAPTGITGVADPAGGTSVRALKLTAWNTPNPFNPRTSIRFELPAPTRVGVQVLSSAGRVVTTLLDGGVQAGSHEVPWDGRDARGATVPSGVYYYRVTAGGSSAAGKMVLLK